MAHCEADDLETKAAHARQLSPAVETTLHLPSIISVPDANEGPTYKTGPGAETEATAPILRR